MERAVPATRAMTMRGRRRSRSKLGAHEGYEEGETRLGAIKAMVARKTCPGESPAAPTTAANNRAPPSEAQSPAMSSR
ncbi:MAG: hypothetical protein Kow00122_15920 [Thermoleophilia bacterium]